MLPHVSTIKHTVSYGFLLKEEKHKLDSNLNKFREWAVATYTSASCCPKSKLDYLGVSTLPLVAINTRYMSYFKQLLDHKLVGNQVHMWLTSRLAARFFPRRTLRRRWKCGSAHHRSSAHGGLMAYDGLRDGPGCQLSGVWKSGTQKFHCSSSFSLNF